MLKKSSIIFVSIFMLLVGCGGSAEKEAVTSTKFPFETGKISYSTNGYDQDTSSTISGEKVFTFKDWGKVIVQKTVRKNTEDGTGSVDEYTVLEKWDNGNYYYVDYDNEVITKSIMNFPISYTYPDVTRYRGKSSTLQTMWTEEVIDRTCLNHLLHDQQDYPTLITWCVVEDKIILKEVVDGSSYGHYETTIANDIQFDIELSDDLFELPDFPKDPSKQGFSSEDFDGQVYVSVPIIESPDFIVSTFFPDGRRVDNYSDDTSATERYGTTRSTWYVADNKLHINYGDGINVYTKQEFSEFHQKAKSLKLPDIDKKTFSFNRGILFHKASEEEVKVNNCSIVTLKVNENLAVYKENKEVCPEDKSNLQIEMEVHQSSEIDNMLVLSWVSQGKTRTAKLILYDGDITDTSTIVVIHSNDSEFQKNTYGEFKSVSQEAF